MNKFKLTESAKQYADSFPKLSDVLTGCENKCASGCFLPNLNFSNLLKQIFESIQIFQIKKGDERDSKYDVKDEFLKRTGQQMRVEHTKDILDNLTVWLMTENDDNQPIPGDEDKTFPDMRKLEPTPDTLGCYVPNNGYIFIWLDKISKSDDPTLEFQMVFLHELIHKIFDLASRGYEIEPQGEQVKSISKTEEEIVSVLTLYVYQYASYSNKEAASYCQTWIKDSISKQPIPYRNAIELYDTKEWYEIRNMLTTFLNNKNK